MIRPIMRLPCLFLLLLAACGDKSDTGSGDPLDHDGDGWKSPEDCDDENASVYPGAYDPPYDGIDEDCGGEDDFDLDGDGFVSDADVGLATVGVPGSGSLPGGDCWDDPRSTPSAFQVVSPAFTDKYGNPLHWAAPTAAEVHPGAEDLPYDGADQDCAGDDDFDADGDGFRSDVYPDATGAYGDDCYDGAVVEVGWPETVLPEQVHPGASEIPGDGLDEDCDGGESCLHDEDGDGFLPAVPNTILSKDADCDDAFEGTWASPLTDCDDTDPATHPEATEQPGDEIDQDCDGTEICLLDADGDGYGPDTAGTLPSDDILCDAPGEHRLWDPNGDCDDDDASIHPGAVEAVGDGVDQDCDGRELCFQDADDDGWLFDTSATFSSSDTDCDDSREGRLGQPAGDCDDRDANVHPTATELVGDEVDQDCNGAEICYLDDDDDGYRPDSLAERASSDLDCTDAREARRMDPTGDCNDASASIHPGATEGVGDGVDQDCDGLEICYLDADDDGYRPDATSTRRSSDADCNDAGEATNTDPIGDCDDTRSGSRPGASETCNGQDDDCDGVVDEDSATDARTWYRDADGDGYGASIASRRACAMPSGYVANASDCDDASASVNPGVASDGTTRLLVDDDCDGFVDEDAVAWGDLVITEINKNSTAGGSSSTTRNPDARWFEVLNVSSRAIDLSNWTIEACDTAGFSRPTLPDWRGGCTTTRVAISPDADLVIYPGDYLVLCQDASVFTDPSRCDHEWSDPSWTGSSPAGVSYRIDDLVFQYPNGILGLLLDDTSIDEVGWYWVSTTDAWPNYFKRTLSLRPGYTSAASNDLKESWCNAALNAWASTPNYNFGTPGSANACE